MCRYRVNQHLIFLNLDKVSVNKTLIIEFITAKVSQKGSFKKYVRRAGRVLKKFVSC